GWPTCRPRSRRSRRPSPASGRPRADMLPFVVSGLVVGSIYAIAAMGLVLTYRTTGLLNFAHGGIAMATAYAFCQLRVEWSVPSALAVPLCIFVFAPLLGVLIDRVLFRV